MEKEIAFKLLTEQLPKGVFLTVKNNNEINSMTIGWATVGRVWGKDVMTVMVRFSRHTYDLIKNAQSFSVSIPEQGTLQKEIGFMGSKSGKDFDKYKETGLNLINGNKIDTPIIKECIAHYECNILYKQAMDPSGIIDKKDVEDSFYEGNNDYHVIFYGEIVDIHE